MVRSKEFKVQAVGTRAQCVARKCEKVENERETVERENAGMSTIDQEEVDEDEASDDECDELILEWGEDNLVEVKAESDECLEVGVEELSEVNVSSHKDEVRMELDVPCMKEGKDREEFVKDTKSDLALKAITELADREKRDITGRRV